MFYFEYGFQVFLWVSGRDCFFHPSPATSQGEAAVFQGWATLSLSSARFEVFCYCFVPLLLFLVFLFVRKCRKKINSRPFCPVHKSLFICKKGLITECASWVSREDAWSGACSELSHCSILLSIPANLIDMWILPLLPGPWRSPPKSYALCHRVCIGQIPYHY